MYVKKVKYLRKILLTIFILMLVFFLLKLFSNNIVTVYVGDEGFQSEEVVIKKGTTIKWIGIGKNPHWPASDFHPTHSEYPDKGGCLGSRLDACRGLEKGEMFEFTFDKEGIWGIHDHLFPGFTMTVYVESKDLPLKKSDIPSANFGKISYIEQKKELTKLAEKDPAIAWDLLKKTFIVDGQVIGNAHELAHVIGNKIYDKLGFEGVQICDDSFAFGCHHGVSERLMILKGAESVSQIEKDCVSLWPVETSQNFTGCIHGAGHGLVSLNSLNLDNALLDCDRFSSQYRHNCYNGAMMEYSTSAPINEFDSSDPWKHCSRLSKQYQLLCAQYQLSIFTKFGWNLSQMDVACQSAPNNELKNQCYLGIGAYVAQDAKGEIDIISDKCFSLSNINGQNQCLTYAADQVIFQEYPNWYQVSLDLCALVEKVKYQDCLNVRKTTIDVYDRKVSR